MHQKYLNKIHPLGISKTFLGTLQDNISLIGEFPSHFNLKNMISTNTKDFSWEKWHKFARFQRKKFQISRFWCFVQEGSQEYRKNFFFYFHI